MKTTDFAMIFVAIILPIIIVVYVDISFLLKTEEQRLYYTNIINSAINDATFMMKTVEGEEQDVDYGYSGLADKKVAVNANIAIDTFFSSLYDNFEITGNKLDEAYIKEHVPALAVVDYNGVYIYSIDEYINELNEECIGHILKPKRFFTYTYAIVGDEIKEVNEIDMNRYEDNNIATITIVFTMDDYITVINNDGTQTGFYLEDNINNSLLYTDNDDNIKLNMRDKVIQHLKIKRAQVISNIVSEEMSCAVSAHNLYSNIDYEFTFPNISISHWEEIVNNIGIIAFVQGINIGNEKLDYVAHGISGLELANRYYVSVLNLKYYHLTEECTVYKEGSKPLDGYYMNKIDAATAGYYPCPVCKP